MGDYRGRDSLFGFSCSGFGGCSGFPVRGFCSACTVDFVEKLWRNLWGSRWENCGFYCGIVQTETRGCGKNRFFAGLVEKFCGWIYTWFYLCKGGGFAQFPHSLLLQLLNI